MSRYLDLDGAAGQFTRFQEFFAEPESWADGHVVVVTGEKGCGKTSLAQRCADWAVRQAAETGRCHVVPVDLLGQEGPSGELCEDRMDRTLQEILRKLGTRLTGEERGRINGGGRAEDKFRELGAILADCTVPYEGAELPLGLVVMLDRYPKAEDMEAFYRIAGKGMLFFAEMFEEEECRRARESASGTWGNVSATYRVLELGALNDDDPEKFVSWVNGCGKGWPWVRPEVTSYFKEKFIPQSVSISQMVKVFWGALDIAWERRDPELNMDHIAEYFAKFAKTLD